MQGSEHAALHAGVVNVPVTLLLLITALVYGRGWHRVRAIFPNMIPAWRVAVFAAGMFSIWIAIGSPLAHRDDELLFIHMVQHLLLMAIGAPLILLGAPGLLLKYGLQEVFSGLEPVFRCGSVRNIARTLTRPAVCWLAGTVTVIGWHTPALFELAMRSHVWHDIQRATFFAAGILFWRPIIEPWRRAAIVTRWSVPLYLFLATLPCDALSAFLTFSDRVVYRSYLSRPQTFDFAALRDQEAAGALMWVCVTFIYLIPAVVVTIRILGDASAPERGTTSIS
jgi:cytochrome c oxidase assembly factor CtaG